MNLLQKMLDNHVARGGSYINPQASMKDGITLMYKEKEKFIPNKLIREAEIDACKMRTGFIRGDDLFTLPYDIAEGIRYNRFVEVLNLLIKKNE